jgi:hypothetical protein
MFRNAVTVAPLDIGTTHPPGVESNMSTNCVEDGQEANGLSICAGNSGMETSESSNEGGSESSERKQSGQETCSSAYPMLDYQRNAASSTFTRIASQ